MIDIRITRNQDHIEFIPTAKLCFFGGGGEPVGQGTCAWGGHVFFLVCKSRAGARRCEEDGPCLRAWVVCRGSGLVVFGLVGGVCGVAQTFSAGRSVRSRLFFVKPCEEVFFGGCLVCGGLACL